jgi:hypothetical protein
LIKLEQQNKGRHNQNASTDTEQSREQAGAKTDG